jgi:hypothetical protein
MLQKSADFIYNAAETRNHARETMSPMAQLFVYASSIRTNSRTLTWWLTRWSVVISEKSTVPQLRKKFHALQWTQRFFTVFTTTWTRSFQSSLSNPYSLRFSLILSYLRLGFPIGFFHSGFHTKIPCEFLFFLVRVTCRTHLISLCSSFHVTDQLSNPYRTTARTIRNWAFSVIENDGPSLEIY